MYEIRWFGLDFRKQKRGAAYTLIYTPSSLLVVNDVLMTMTKGGMWANRKGSVCFERMAKINKKPKLLTILWAEAAGAGRVLKNKAAAANRFRWAPISALSSRSPVLLLSDLLNWSVITQRELSLWKEMKSVVFPKFMYVQTSNCVPGICRNFSSPELCEWTRMYFEGSCSKRNFASLREVHCIQLVEGNASHCSFSLIASCYLTRGEFHLMKAVWGGRGAI